MRKIELLAPARNAEIAKEAILHGADAVYIGASRFGARAAAGNSVDDIRSVVEFAHIYGVKVYVTLNTILFDDELDDVRCLALQLKECGVDAFIVQDMAFVEMHLPGVSLHASTQMDNRTPEKVKWLRELGFEQAVLARELTLDQIREIHQSVPDMPLEVFVHGATCVSYNGQCYASQYCFGRSANRGECAQFCRLPFDLIDDKGNVVKDNRTGQPMIQRHILSLHDMNRSDEIEELLDAGVTSFKIEGRLKDVSYVKNVTAYYRKCIDEVIRRHPSEYERSSVGVSTIGFTPQLDRTFNRGFSNYFLHGRTFNMVQFCSPKSMGQYVGQVKEIRRKCFTVRGTESFSNGDGLCYVDAKGKLQGVRVNRVEGNCLYPKEMPSDLIPRLSLYRNYDQAFMQELSRPTAQRKISVSWYLTDIIPEGVVEYTTDVDMACKRCGQNALNHVVIRLQCSDGISVEKCIPIELSESRIPQYDNMSRQLSRLGDTPFICDSINVRFSKDWFIPSSVLSEWRRMMTHALINERVLHCQKKNFDLAPTRSSNDVPSFIGQSLSYRANVANRLARDFYQRRGVKSISPALEVDKGSSIVGCNGIKLMTLKYCPKHELGYCGVSMPPLFLRSSDGNVYPLHFNCKLCQVSVMSPYVK